MINLVMPTGGLCIACFGCLAPASGYVPELCNLGWGPFERGNSWQSEATGLLKNLGATYVRTRAARGYLLEVTQSCKCRIPRWSSSMHVPARACLQQVEDLVKILKIQARSAGEHKMGAF